MKKSIILILLVLRALAINAQERSVRVDVVKMNHVTTAERDLYVVPNDQTWKIYNVTTGQKEINIGGTGWVADTGSGGTTYTAGTGLALNTTEFSLDPALVTKLGYISVTQPINLDNLSLDASGFNGNLSTTDDTLQEIAQALDDISTVGADNLGNHTATADLDMGEHRLRHVSSTGFTMRFGYTGNQGAGTAIYGMTIDNNSTGPLSAFRYYTSSDEWIFDSGFRISDLSGTGDRMVVANTDGKLSTQAIPSGGGADNLGNHTATQDLDLDDNHITNVYNIEYSAILDAGITGYTRMDHAGSLRRVETHNNNDKYTVRALTRLNTGSSFNVESEFEYDFLDQRWEIDDQPIMGGSGTTDSAIMDGSTNPVENNAIYDEFQLVPYLATDFQQFTGLDNVFTQGLKIRGSGSGGGLHIEGNDSGGFLRAQISFKEIGSGAFADDAVLGFDNNQGHFNVNNTYSNGILSLRQSGELTYNDRAEFSGTVSGSDGVNSDDFATVGQLNNVSSDTSPIVLTVDRNLASTDLYRVLEYTGTDTLEVTIPASLGNVGDMIKIISKNAGSVKPLADSGVTYNNYKTRTDGYSTLTLYKSGADEWGALNPYTLVEYNVSSGGGSNHYDLANAAGDDSNATTGFTGNGNETLGVEADMDGSSSYSITGTRQAGGGFTNLSTTLSGLVDGTTYDVVVRAKVEAGVNPLDNGIMQIWDAGGTGSVTYNTNSGAISSTTYVDHSVTVTMGGATDLTMYFYASENGTEGNKIYISSITVTEQ